MYTFKECDKMDQIPGKRTLKRTKLPGCPDKVLVLWPTLVHIRINIYMQI